MISEDDKFTVFPASKNFAKPDMINIKQNVISGPNTKPSNPGMMYWSHSKGDQKPMEREEGPFPIQGNIGSLVKNEINNYSNCTDQYPISGSKNCANAFTPDAYTLSNTCGKECDMNAPESFGDKDFGLSNGINYTNAHGIHAYKNVRAGAAGQSDQSGCYEFIPNVGSAGNGVCGLKPQAVYQQVGDWTKLKENKSILSSSFNPNFK